MATPHDRPWLIAAWPGMGSVALIAAGYLVQTLRMEQSGRLPARDHFDVNEVTVKDGVLEPVRLPQGTFFQWKNPRAGRDLVVFIGEAQPTAGTYAYAHELLEAAAEMGISRVVTFASMASALHPSENPRVSGIATDSLMLEELTKAEVSPLPDGQIGGLNGVLLAAAGERNIPGMCLLAEIPFFAATVPNPKAARAALSVFSVLAGIDVSLDELNKHAAAVDRVLLEAYEKLAASESVDEESKPEESPGEAPEETPDAEAARPPTSDSPKLDYAARQHIEQLFAEARADLSKAMALKQELDRRGVFKQYEDRFLDLFRRAG